MVRLDNDEKAVSSKKKKKSIKKSKPNSRLGCKNHTQLRLKWPKLIPYLCPKRLIGSFLSSIRVQTDKILISTSFQVQLSAVKLSTF